MSQVYPEPTVGALIFDPEERLLLTRSHKWRGMYVIPGGHVELGETLEQALHREIREETGLEVHDVQFLGLQEFIYDEAFWEPRHFLFCDFACRADSAEVRLNDEAQEYTWVPLAEIDALPVEPYTLRTLAAYLALQDGSASGAVRMLDR